MSRESTTNSWTSEDVLKAAEMILREVKKTGPDVMLISCRIYEQVKSRCVNVTRPPSFPTFDLFGIPFEVFASFTALHDRYVELTKKGKDVAIHW